MLISLYKAPGPSGENLVEYMWFCSQLGRVIVCSFICLIWRLNHNWNSPAVMVCTLTSCMLSLSGPSWYQIRSRKCYGYSCCFVELNQWMNCSKSSCLIILYNDLTQVLLFAIRVFTNFAKLDPICYWTEPAVDLKVRVLLVLKVHPMVHHRLKNACWELLW